MRQSYLIAHAMLFDKAFNQSTRFIANNEARIDRNQACYMPAMTINRWLAVRLEFLGSCLMFSTALVSVSALLISNSVDAGLVGLMMTYTISVTGTLVRISSGCSKFQYD